MNGQVAEQDHRAGRGPRRLPLILGQPLEILAVPDVIAELDTRVGEREGVAVAEPVGPFRPRRMAAAFVQGAEEGVVVEPPRLFLGEPAERARPLAAAAQLGVAKPLV